MASEEQYAKHERLLMETLDEIWQTVDESAIPRFKAARYRTVDSEEIRLLIDDFKNNLPAELRRANSVINEANTIIDDAEAQAKTLVSDAQKRADNIQAKVEHDTQTMTDEANEYRDNKIFEADKYYQTQTVNGDAYYNSKLEEAHTKAGRIVADGVAERDRLVSETEIIRVAEENAEKIINDAKNWADELRRKTIIKSNEVYTSAKESADTILGELMRYLGEYYAAVEKDRQAIGIRQYRGGAGAQQRQPADGGRQSAENELSPDEEDNDEDERREPFRFADWFKRRKKRSTEDNDKDNDKDDEDDEDKNDTDYDDMSEE